MSRPGPSKFLPHVAPRVLVASSVGLFACLVVASLASAIVRRHDVDDDAYIVEASEFPAVVDLFPGDPGDCLATLITPEWLITAAHCAEDLRISDPIVVGAARYTLLRIDNHEGWNQDTDDISLLQIDGAVSDVAPIPWYLGDDELDQVMWFVGRGDTSTGQTGGGRVDGNTRAATNTVIAVTRYWLEFEFNSPQEPEVTPLEGISGDGDSGGPALVETVDGLRVAGLSSFQDNGSFALGSYGVREFYTRVSRYQSWIEERTGPSPVLPGTDMATLEPSPSGEGDEAAETAAPVTMEPEQEPAQGSGPEAEGMVVGVPGGAAELEGQDTTPVDGEASAPARSAGSCGLSTSESSRSLWIILLLVLCWRVLHRPAWAASRLDGRSQGRRNAPGKQHTSSASGPKHDAP